MDKKEIYYTYAKRATIGYLFIVFIYSLAMGSAGKGILSLELNNVGDFLAGVFSPLAFLWLIVGYKQQQIEIGLNTEALNHQVREFSKMVEIEKLKYEESLSPTVSNMSIQVMNKRGGGYTIHVRGSYSGPRKSFSVIISKSMCGVDGKSGAMFVASLDNLRHGDEINEITFREGDFKERFPVPNPYCILLESSSPLGQSFSLWSGSMIRDQDVHGRYHIPSFKSCDDIRKNGVSRGLSDALKGEI